jgi:glutathione S-transferase
MILPGLGVPFMQMSSLSKLSLRLARRRAILCPLSGPSANHPLDRASPGKFLMFKLHSSTTSPFGRKVKVAALFTGHTDRITILNADTMNPADPLRLDNPLGKVPCLVLEDGTTLYDSRVIVEFLDHDAGGGKILPKEWGARLAALKLQALADGIIDAAILKLYEGRFRAPEKHEPAWIAHQAGKVERGLTALEAHPPVASANPDIGTISVACMLEWYEFRFSGLSGGQYPKLSAFLKAFNEKVPAFAKTFPRA